MLVILLCVSFYFNSDIDIVVISSKPNYLNQYRETIYSNGSGIDMPIDVRNINLGNLKKETEGLP